MLNVSKQLNAHHPRCDWHRESRDFVVIRRAGGQAFKKVLAFGRTTRAASVLTLAAKGGKATAGKGFGAPKQQAGHKGIAVDAPCPCGSGAQYQACCAPYHAAPATVPSPEALLRARFSAYVVKNPEFVADTTHPDSNEYIGTRTTMVRSLKPVMARVDPLQLTVLTAAEPAAAAPAAAATGGGSGGAEEAFLTFLLRRRIRDPDAPGNKAEVEEVVERSRFRRERGRWFFMDSEFPGEGGAVAAGSGQPKAETEQAAAEAPKKGFLGLF